MKTLFRLGQVVITPAALDYLGVKCQNWLELVHRHSTGDWGTLSDLDWEENEIGLQAGLRIFSSYLVDGQEVWVITEADRSVTTVLLPDDY